MITLRFSGMIPSTAKCPRAAETAGGVAPKDGPSARQTRYPSGGVASLAKTLLGASDQRRTEMTSTTDATGSL
jgi:hypothetical protein